MNILGISYNYHDAAACLLRDGVPVAAAEEERFTRQKHDAGFPEQAIKYCIAEGGIKLSELECVVFYEKPARKLERLLQIVDHLRQVFGVMPANILLNGGDFQRRIVALNRQRPARLRTPGAHHQRRRQPRRPNCQA